MPDRRVPTQVCVQRVRQRLRPHAQRFLTMHADAVSPSSAAKNAHHWLAYDRGGVHAADLALSDTRYPYRLDQVAIERVELL
jgi:hypothetical protein